MVRAPFYDENGVKKGAWSEEEDKILKDYVESHGHWNWRELPKLAGLSRCGKSCRLRWINYLRPDVKRGNYSREEEDIILKLHHQHGNKWSLIAAQLPGRTDNEIKNYWHTRLKKLNKTKAAKKQHYEANSDSKAMKTRTPDMKTKLKLDEIPCHEIFESSPVSSWSSSELSNACSNHESVSSSDMVPPTTAFALQGSVGEDFWGQPFESEESVLFNVGGFDSDFCDLVFDNDEDLFYQVMKELPENYQFQLY